MVSLKRAIVAIGLFMVALVLLNFVLLFLPEGDNLSRSLRGFGLNLLKATMFFVVFVAGLSTMFLGWGVFWGKVAKTAFRRSFGQFYQRENLGGALPKFIDYMLIVLHVVVVVIFGVTFGALLLPIVRLFVQPVNDWTYRFFSLLKSVGHDFTDTSPSIPNWIVYWTAIVFSFSYWFHDPGKEKQG